MATTSFVIFGGSGDLSRRKLLPALFRLHSSGRIAECSSVFGVSRKAMSKDAYRAFALDAIASAGIDPDPDAGEAFAAVLGYHSCDVTDPEELAGFDEVLGRREGPDGADRLYYLALPPRMYPEVVGAMHAAGMTKERPGGPRRRAIVEKPFGRDRASADILERVMHEAFEEHQIYRIDHFLGKETVQNLLVVRFANAIFEPVWNRTYVDSVQITVAETLGVAHRGAYYEQSGVLRDMFQNHLMQLLTLVAMEPPPRFEADLLRNEKVKVLAAVRDVDPRAVADMSVQAQYEGYRAEDGVDPESVVPTYAAVRFHVDNWRWQGVPFYLRSGKALAKRVSEIAIRFKRPPVGLFESGVVAQAEGASGAAELASNHLSLCIQPEEGIHLRFQTKIPDEGMAMRSSMLDFDYRAGEGVGGGGAVEGARLPDSYERLLVDAVKGDPSLFTRVDEIELAWDIIDPIVTGCEHSGGPPLVFYRPGSWGPSESDELLAREGRRWILGCAGEGLG